MSRWLCVGLISVALPIGCWAASDAGRKSDPHDALVEANQLFEKGDLSRALNIYQDLVQQGFEGAALYYDLGNVYFKMGERGRAVLWYERARRLAPRDSDIQFNLGLARSHLKDTGESPFERILFYFTPSELAVGASVLIWIFFILLGLRILGSIRGESWPGLALWFSGICLAVAGAWFGGTLYLVYQPTGVVIAPPGEVRNGPGEDYSVGFTMPEGSEVTILNRRPDWVQVGVVQQGLKGWMPSKDLEAISLS